MNRLRIGLPVLFFGLSLLASISQASPKGNFIFDDLSKDYGNPKVEINLSAALLGMVGTLAKVEEPEVGELLRKLEYIRVRVYNTGGDTQAAINSIAKHTQALRKDKWEVVVSVNEASDHVQIFSRSTDGLIDGLVLMAVSEGDTEAIFINIVGEIDPANIAKVTESFDISINGEATP